MYVLRSTVNKDYLAHHLGEFFILLHVYRSGLGLYAFFYLSIYLYLSNNKRFAIQLIMQ